MYNRYVRNDKGEYRRIPVVEEKTDSQRSAREKTDARSSTPFGQGPPSSGSAPGKDGLFSGILGKLKLDEIDTGDLLLLVILFLLFRDGEDDELLIALGLLLIL